MKPRTRGPCAQPGAVPDSSVLFRELRKRWSEARRSGERRSRLTRAELAALTIEGKSPADVAALVDRYRTELDAGLGALPDVEVAEALGVSASRVRQVRCRLGIRHRSGPSPESMSLADWLGAHKTRVSEWASGVASPPLWALAALADALGVALQLTGDGWTITRPARPVG